MADLGCHPKLVHTCNGGKWQTLDFIAVSKNDENIKMVLEGRKVGVIEPINQDLEGHIAREVFNSIKYKNLPYLKLGFEYLIKNRGLNAQSLSEHFF